VECKLSELVNKRRSICKLYDVVALIPCRDGQDNIERTIRSILNQSVKTFVSVADDASIDNTPNILKNLSKTGRVRYIRYTRREKKDYARVPVLLNMALRISPPARYYLISGDDCIYPKDYCENLIKRMEKDRVDMCSGFTRRYNSSSLPSGSGRLITSELFKKITPLPRTIGWESWMIYKTLYLGKRVSVYPIEFKHYRKYSIKSTWTFGQSAYVNGVPLTFTLLRTIKNVILNEHNLINSLAILLGHIEYSIRKVEKLDIAPFTRKMHLRRLSGFVHNLLKI